VTGLTIAPVLASREQISRQIKAHLGVGSETIEGLLAQQDEEEIEILDDVDASELAEAQEASVIRLVNEILCEAVESRASDVHIESQAAGLRIRYRIDGILQSQPAPPEISRFQAAIISRLKIMARLNIAEKRLPQDGRIKLRMAGREVDVRVSVIPMLHGEGIVMRLLDKGRMNFSLEALGMEPDLHHLFSELIRMPHGIVLVTGPTGSGKTTTLYAALSEIKSISRSGVSLELSLVITTVQVTGSPIFDRSVHAFVTLMSGWNRFTESPALASTSFRNPVGCVSTVTVFRYGSSASPGTS